MRLLVPVLLLFLRTLGSGQPFSPGERAQERIEHFKKVRLIETLDLSEEQSARFFARLKDHDKAKKDALKEKMDVLDRIERLVRNRAEGQEFDKPFSEVAALNQRLADLDQRFFNSLSDILSVEQRGKYLLFERRFELELREAMRDIQRRRLGPKGMGE
jgi:hypothetical protein